MQAGHTANRQVVLINQLISSALNRVTIQKDERTKKNVRIQGK